CDGGTCPAGYATTGTVTVSLAAADAGSGVAAIHYTTDGSAPTAAGAVYTGAFTVTSTTTVRWLAVDRVGNEEAPGSLTIRIDASAPSMPTVSFGGFANAAATGSTVWFRPGVAGGFTLTPDSADAESGVAAYSYPELGGGWTRNGGAYAFGASAAEPGAET